jgi:hypothetical protein
VSGCKGHRRDYRLKQVPQRLAGAEIVQTANEDDGSSGRSFLTLEAVVPVEVYVGIDTRMAQPPAWVQDDFLRSHMQIEADDWTYELSIS